MLRHCAGPWMIATWLLAHAGAGAAQGTLPDLSGYVTLGSGYWKNGLAKNNGASLQLGIDWQHPSGFFTYGNVTNLDLPHTPGSYAATPDVEASAYAGYHARRASWSWTVSGGRYFYSNTEGRYDYNEVSASVGFRDRVFYTASYAPDYYNRARAALNQEVSVAFPLRGDLEIGGAVGRFTQSEGGWAMTHWNVGVSKLVRRMAIDLRYYDGDFDWRAYLGDPHTNHYVLSVSYALRGRSPGR